MMNITMIGFRCLVLAMFVFGASVPATAGDGKIFTLAVIPSAPPVTLYTQWIPFAERLSRKTGVEFRLKLYEKMAEFERDIWSGAPDFIFASPIQTVVAHQRHRYVPFIRGGNLISVGLIVRKDSDIRTIYDLHGKTISFVGNKNLCSVFVRHMLSEQKEKVSFASENAGSTRNVIKRVLLGKSAAGAVFIPELEREPAETREQLLSIIETPKIAPHPLSAHPRVPREVRDMVKKVVLEMAATKEGAELLKTVRLAAPVSADYARDYQSLEVIDIKGLTDWGQ